MHTQTVDLRFPGTTSSRYISEAGQDFIRKVPCLSVLRVPAWICVPVCVRVSCADMHVSLYAPAFVCVSLHANACEYEYVRAQYVYMRTRVCVRVVCASVRACICVRAELRGQAFVFSKCVMQLLVKDPTKRMSLVDAQIHPWIAANTAS